MKLRQIILPAALVLSSFGSYAQQLPNSFNYQAVINADDGTPVASKDITVEISILQGSDCEKNPSGCPVLWQELQTPSTNEFGLFNVEIGASSATNTHVGTSENFSDINWLDVTDGYYFLKVRVDFGESEFLNGMNDLGTSKFSAVPYSLVALTTDLAERAKNLDKDADGKVSLKLSELADVTVPASATDGQYLSLKDGKWIVVDAPQGGSGTSVTKLSELTGDVKLTSPTKDQVLTYDGSKWVNGSAPASVTKLSELTGDVTLSTLTKDQVLKYDGSKWTNGTVSTSSAVTKLSELTGDVTLSSSLASGQFLKYNGSKWANSVLALADISNVSLTSPTDGQILKYNGTNWINSDEGSSWLTNSDGNLYTLKKVGIGYSDPSDLLYIGTKASYTKFTGANIIMSTGNIMLDGDNTIGTNTACSIAGRNGVAKYTNCIAFGGDGTAGSDQATANGYCSMAFGNGCNTNGCNNSAAFGCFTKLNASTSNAFACGQYNDYTIENVLFTVGNGTSDTRANAFYVTKTGEAYANSVELSSDSRLKTNVSTLENALDEVMKLRGVTFNWDLSKKPNASTSLQYGFIAQEVEEVFPDLVTTDGNGYKSLNYIGIIPVLTEAVKAQQTEIENLKSENAELKSTLESLLKRVEALENK